MKPLLVALVAAALALAPAATWPGDKPKDKKEGQKAEKKKKGGQDEGPEAEEINREITRILRDLQFALEGGSARGFLSLIDSAKFDDYLRFEDMVERLMREDTIRAYFRQVTSASSPAEGKAQTVVEAEMELGRKDAAGQLQRRRQQLVLDFGHSRRGWRIINITPRNYFEPL